MTDKRQREDLPESEIAQIEQDFKQVFGEMTDITSIREFSGVFRQLHSLLMDSHAKNQTLSDVVQTLNVQIVSNATKVASLLRMSEADQATIARCRREYEQTWQSASASQAKELGLLEQCDALRSEIAQLNASIEEQGNERNSIHALKADIESYASDTAKRSHEMDVLQSDLDRVQLVEHETTVSMDRIRKTIHDLAVANTHEDEAILKMRESATALQQEVGQLVAENDDSAKLAEGNATALHAQRARIGDEHRELAELTWTRRDFQVETDAMRKGLKAAAESRDRAVTAAEGSARKIRRIAPHIESLEIETSELHSRSARCNDRFARHESELAHLQRDHATSRREIEECQARRRGLVDELVTVMRRHNFSERQIRDSMRAFDTRLRQFQFTKSQVASEVAHSRLTAANSRLVGTDTSAAKGDLEVQNIKVATIEEDLRTYEQRSHEAKGQLIQFADSAAIVEENLDYARRALGRLTKSLKEHDDMIQELQDQRDKINNSIKSVQSDNARLEVDLKVERHQAATLKQDLQLRAEEAIAVHFQTRSIERQMTTLTSATESTQRLLDEANVAVHRWKAEEIRLRLTHDEAVKDAARTKAEFSSVVDIAKLITKQLSDKKKEADDNTGKLDSMRHKLRQHAVDFERQTDGIRGLEDEFERGLFRHRWLKQRAAVSHAMQLEIALLETRISKEREIRKKYEIQLQRPMNVHRWTLLKAASPDHYQAIQLVQTLKTQLESTFRRRQRLQDTKVALFKCLAQKNERIRNAHVVDGNYALSAVRDSATSKDRELRTMEDQLRSGRSRVFELESIVGDLKTNIKHSHSLATSVRRKQQKDVDIPTLPIGAKVAERTRLGGGFMLTQSALANKPKICDPENDELSGRPGQKKPQKSASASARAESTVSWRPTLNPELSVTSVSSLGRDGDPVKRKPRVEVIRSKRGTREASAQSSAPRSARSSAYSSGSRQADGPRPQVKLHSAILHF
jgi:chromosome segregation ATPase